MGEEFEVVEPGASIVVYSTDQGEQLGGQLIRLMRATVLERVPLLLALLVQTWSALEWDAPNPPTESDLAQLVTQVERVHEALAVLKQLSPEVIDDDDDDAAPEDPEPQPPSERTRSEVVDRG